MKSWYVLCTWKNSENGGRFLAYFLTDDALSIWGVNGHRSDASPRLAVTRVGIAPDPDAVLFVNRTTLLAAPS